MSEQIKNVANPTIVSSQLRGETIAYAVQSGVMNLAANFFEPYVGYRAQKYFSSNPRDKASYGNYGQNLAGEFAGDLIGCSSLIAAETLCPQQLHTTTKAIRRWLDPVYLPIARAVFADEKEQPDYEQKVQQWKTFQERNLVRSSIMASTGIAGNVLAQKMVIGNPSPANVIFKGKLLSTALTTSLGLATRFVLPHQTRSLDKWLGKKVFAPMLEDTALPNHNHSYAHQLRHEKQKETELSVN